MATIKDMEGAYPPPRGFTAHLPQKQAQQAITAGSAFSARLRLAAQDRTDGGGYVTGYVTVEGLPHDIIIKGDFNRNRALAGDEVVVEVLPPALWHMVRPVMPEALRESFKKCKQYLEGKQYLEMGGDPSALTPSYIMAAWVQARFPEAAKQLLCEVVQSLPAGSVQVAGRVVGLGKLGKRREQLVGVLQVRDASDTHGQVVWLLPRDPTMPTCLVQPSGAVTLQDLLREAGMQLGGTLVSARVVKWDVEDANPSVIVKRILGQVGSIEGETAAILAAQGVCEEKFSHEVLQCLPASPWVVTAEDMAGRRDFRNTRIFTIDPSSARDLDDALHITPVQGVPGHWHVGVHVADVSHFVRPGNALDAEARDRSTSVYLVQKAVPMLPPMLSEDVCSLVPGVDRLAFSIEWELDERGEVVRQWAGRSVIRSRTKLAYGMVQEMIDGKFKPDECIAKLYEGATWDDVVGDCQALNSLAQQRRARRFGEGGGSLCLEGIKLMFALDDKGMPVSVGHHRGGDANHLVEEFMLLANLRVAALIAQGLPDRAMLRCHAVPNARKLGELTTLSDAHGLGLDCSTAGALHSSLARLDQVPEDAGKLGLVVQMAIRSMQSAQYFCTGQQPDRDLWKHYGLSEPEYTHFTSPIHRYPDVAVHRLLAAVLDARPELTFASEDYYGSGQEAVFAGGADREPSAKDVTAKQVLLTPGDLGEIAWHSNDKRMAARNVQDGSLRLYLRTLLRHHPVVTSGLVSYLGGAYHFRVYLPAYGIELSLDVGEHAPFLDASFDRATKTLTLKLKGEQEQAGPLLKRHRHSNTEPDSVAATQPANEPDSLAATQPADKHDGLAVIQQVDEPDMAATQQAITTLNPTASKPPAPADRSCQALPASTTTRQEAVTGPRLHPGLGLNPAAAAFVPGAFNAPAAPVVAPAPAPAPRPVTVQSDKSGWGGVGRQMAAPLLGGGQAGPLWPGGHSWNGGGSAGGWNGDGYGGRNGGRNGGAGRGWNGGAHGRGRGGRNGGAYGSAAYGDWDGAAYMGWDGSWHGGAYDGRERAGYGLTYDNGYGATYRGATWASNDGTGGGTYGGGNEAAYGAWNGGSYGGASRGWSLRTNEAGNGGAYRVGSRAGSVGGSEGTSRGGNGGRTAPAHGGRNGGAGRGRAGPGTALGSTTSARTSRRLAGTWPGRRRCLA